MLRRAFTSLIIIIALAAFLVSCVSTSPFEGQKAYFIQALGEEGNLVAGISLSDKSSRIYRSLLEHFPQAEAVLQRSDRLSVAVTPDGTLYGGLEGDFPKVFADAAIGNSPVEGLSLTCPVSGLVIFSTGDIDTAVKKTWTERRVLIPYVQAIELCGGDLALYSDKPAASLEFGMDLGKEVLSKISGIYVSLRENEEHEYVMYADFALYDRDNAQSLNKILRTIHVSDLKRDGRKPDIKDLKSRFSVWDSVTVRYLTITDERAGKIISALYGDLK